MTVYPGTDVGFGTIARTLFVRYRSRAVLGLVLIASQAFFYNGISFSFPLVLNSYFGVPADRTGLYVMVIGVANLLGPLLLGHFFDTVGRRKMIGGYLRAVGRGRDRHASSLPAGAADRRRRRRCCGRSRSSSRRRRPVPAT